MMHRKIELLNEKENHMQYRWLILMLCALPSIQTANAAPYDYDETTQTLTIEFKGTSATNIFQTSSAPVNHSEGVCTAEGECSPGVSQIYIAQGVPDSSVQSMKDKARPPAGSQRKSPQPTAFFTPTSKVKTLSIYMSSLKNWPRLKAVSSIWFPIE